MLTKITITISLFIIAISSAIDCQPQITSYTDPIPSSQQLNCVFTFDSSTSTYDCISTNTTIKTPGSGFYEIDGNHIGNKTNYDISGLKISSQTCHFMPNKLNDFIPNLKKLEITYSGMLGIDEYDTYELTHLTHLNLKGNRIGELSYRLFKFNTNLISIDFSDNFIKVIADDLLTPFDRLNYIDFGNNLCVKNQIANDNFREWERELKRNCEPVDKFYGVTQPLLRIADNLERNNYQG